MSSDSAIILDYHAGMLADRPRVEGFRRAIAAVVREGDVVVDVGTGTGILAALCARAGARKVYALEVGPIGALAEELIAANGLRDRVEIVRAHSSTWQPPEAADVLVSETLWNFGFGEGLVEIVRDMRRRVLAHDARLIPSSFDMVVAPVSDPRLWEAVRAWSGEVEGYALQCGRPLAANGIFIRRVDPTTTLGDGRSMGRVDLTAEEIDPNISGKGAWTVSGDTTVHGLAGWFEAQLAPGVTIANAPGAGQSWSTVFLPVDPPLDVSAGADVAVEFSSTADGRELRWTLSASGETRRQSTFHGRLLSPEWIQRRAHSTEPELAPLGTALRDALTKIGEGGSVGDVHALLEERYGDVLHGRLAREEFVTKLMTDYCA